jgi:hypothetical protein
MRSGMGNEVVFLPDVPIQCNGAALKDFEDNRTYFIVQW